MKYTRCEKCNKDISNSNIKRHLSKCSPKIIEVDENWRTVDGKYKCPLCYEDFSKFGISNHIKVTHFGISRDVPNGRVAWNKGLTAETDERVARQRDSLKYNYANGI